MEKTFLLSSSFENSGYGVNDNANELIKLNIGLEPVDISKVKFKTKKSKAISNVYSFYYLERKYKVFKGQKVLVMEPYLLPKKFINIPNKKAVFVHDFYVFDKDYINNVKRRRFPKNVFRYFVLKRVQKSYENIKFYDKVGVYSQKFKERLISEFGVKEEKIDVLQFSVVDDIYQPLNRSENSKRDKIVIGYINGFGANKVEKLKVFIEHFKKLKDSSIELHLYGKGFPLAEEIKNEENIKYYGFLPQDKIVETYNSFDAYLSTSTMEGFGFPIMKAKACKIPVLCYDGDLIEIVKRNTLLWNENNIDEILRNKSWNKVDVEKAYQDAAETRPSAVKENMQRFLESF